MRTKLKDIKEGKKALVKKTETLLRCGNQERRKRTRMPWVGDKVERLRTQLRE